MLIPKTVDKYSKFGVHANSPVIAKGNSGGSSPDGSVNQFKRHICIFNNGTL